MPQHPWTELQLIIKEKWLTQKAFASLLWKKVSELNELLKWKRNFTIQRDYLLHQTIWTPIKFRILKQIDYDYSLLRDIDNSDQNSEKLASPLTKEKEEITNNIDEEIETDNLPKNVDNNQSDEDLKIRATIFRDF